MKNYQINLNTTKWLDDDTKFKSTLYSRKTKTDYDESSTNEIGFVSNNKMYAIQTTIEKKEQFSESDFNKINPLQNISFVPSHPIAGLEKSGPEFGFSKLFENRYCILTPFQQDDKAIESISDMWKSIGMTIEIMDAERHDRVLAMTSHIPQLIAYSVVGTATELESHMRDEVIKYSAAGFRDFTRLAGSDPIMWRDVYQKNKNAVLEMLGRFSEDLSTYQKAIRNGDLEFLENKFNQSKKIRKEIEDIGQAGSFDPTEKKN